jgi:hypothetical protein
LAHFYLLTYLAKRTPSFGRGSWRGGTEPEEEQSHVVAAASASDAQVLHPHGVGAQC